jgi:hypothetical protein
MIAFLLVIAGIFLGSLRVRGYAEPDIPPPIRKGDETNN